MHEFNVSPAKRAEVQARRVPWQKLLHARNEYIDWQEFYLWVRSLLESENRIADWLIEILKDDKPVAVAVTIQVEFRL